MKYIFALLEVCGCCVDLLYKIFLFRGLWSILNIKLTESKVCQNRAEFLNLCSSGLNSQMLLWSQKSGVKCSY